MCPRVDWLGMLAETNLSDNVSKGRLAWNAASRDDDAPSEKKKERFMCLERILMS